MMTSLYRSVGLVDAIRWACVLCSPRIQNDWASRAMNLYQILREAWTFLCGNYLSSSEGRSYGQLVIGSFITTMPPLMHHISCRVLWQNIKSPPCDFCLSPKLKTPLKGKRFQAIDEIQKMWQGSWWWLGELCEVSRCLLWRVLRCHCPLYNVSCIFFNKCLYFSYYMAKYLLDRPCMLRSQLGLLVYQSAIFCANYCGLKYTLVYLPLLTPTCSILTSFFFFISPLMFLKGLLVNSLLHQTNSCPLLSNKVNFLS